MHILIFSEMNAKKESKKVHYSAIFNMSSLNCDSDFSSGMLLFIVEILSVALSHTFLIACGMLRFQLLRRHLPLSLLG